MSTVLLDLGNTRWKLAAAKSGRPGPARAGTYDGDRSLLADLSRVIADPDRVLIASVARPEVVEALVADLTGRQGLAVRVIGSTDTMPNVRSGYRKPEQLGVDRLMAMVAARSIHPEKPLCVIDAGTAITMDFVDVTGQHLGGFILPGLQMYRDCLLANTAIPRDSRPHPDDRLGRDTPTAVALAARYSVAGIAETFTTGTRTLFDHRPVEFVIGGGDANVIAGLLPSACTNLEHLVLTGLAVIAASGE